MSDGKTLNNRNNNSNTNRRNTRNKTNNNNKQVYQNSNKYWVQPQPPHPNAVYLPYPQVPQYIVQQPNVNNNNSKVFQKQRNSRSKSLTRSQNRSNSKSDKQQSRARSQSRQRSLSVNFNINTTKSTDNNASHNIGPEQDAIKYLRWRKNSNYNGRPATAAKYSFALPMANRIDQCLVRSKLNDDIFALCFNLQHSAFYNDSLWSNTNHKPSSDDAQHLISIVRTACDVYIERLTALLSSDNGSVINSVITIGKS